MRTLLMTALFSVELLTAGQQMNVVVCNLGDVHESIITGAQTETQVVYHWVGVQIVWQDCKAFRPPAGQTHDPWFVIRLRTDRPPLTAGPASLDVMGKAFVEAAGGCIADAGGCMADAYFQSIQTTSERHHGDAGVLLGFVMAHELGHLLLGPGHTPGGVMQAAWGQKQMDSMRQGRLRFNEQSAARIRHALEARTATSDASGK